MSIELERRPTHPGEILKEDVLPSIGMSGARLGEVLEVSRQQMSKILNGEARITSDLAVKLGEFLGNNPEFWLKLQVAVNVWEDTQKLQKSGTLHKIRETRKKLLQALGAAGAAV